MGEFQVPTGLLGYWLGKVTTFKYTLKKSKTLCVLSDVYTGYRHAKLRTD